MVVAALWQSRGLMPRLIPHAPFAHSLHRSALAEKSALCYKCAKAEHQGCMMLSETRDSLRALSSSLHNACNSQQQRDSAHMFGQSCAGAPCPDQCPTQPYRGLEALPDALQDDIWLRLGLQTTAVAATVCTEWRRRSARALEVKLAISAADLPLLSRQHNYLLLGDGDVGGEAGATSCGGGAGGCMKHRILGYVPAALHYASQHCLSLQRVHLELPPPQVPLSAAADAVARAVAGEPWQAVSPAPLAALAAAAAYMGCPPVDGYIMKLLAQSCPDLRSLRLVNVTNNATMNRLVRLNDSCLAILARSCPLLEELVLGHCGGEECIFNHAAAFYLEDVTDLGLQALAQHSSRLRRLGLLRCSRVRDQGLSLVAQMCRQLTSLLLHDCPGVSERTLLEVGKHCTQLRALDCTVARRSSGLLMMGEEAEQLGFRALFTIAANCPLLEELRVSEEGLDAPVVDDDCIICLAQGCQRLRSLALRHCGAVTDTGARAVASRCKQLQELVLEHTAVGDAGVLALARGLPLLRTLCLTNFISSLGHMAFLLGPPREVRGISDAGLQHIAEHCTALHHLAITGSRRVTDAGLLHLAHRPAAAAAAAMALPSASSDSCRPSEQPSPLPPPLVESFHRRLTSLTINHTAAKDSTVCEMLSRCANLRCLSLRGLLYNADATVARVADSCRHLTALDLRHCSTLSDTGLGEVVRLPFLRTLHLSFCVRITDAGLRQLATASCGYRVTGTSHAGQLGGPSCGHAHASLHRSRTSLESSLGWSAGASWAVHRTTSSSEVQLAGVWGTESSGGTPLGSAGASWHGGRCNSSGSGSCMLQEIDLYHVPQVTHRGICFLVEACPHLRHINIGKCRLVRVESLPALLSTRGVRLSVCHYLDST